MKKSKRVLGAKAAAPAKTGRVEEASSPPKRIEVSVREAKDQLSSLLQRATEGEEIVITSDGEPKAMLVRHRPLMGGRPWRSLAELRATMPESPDSTGLLRQLRDSGH